MKLRNLVVLLIISIFTVSIYAACTAPKKTGEVTEPAEEKAETQEATESKEIVKGVDQYEPNNSKENATSIEFDQEIKGTIYRRGDKDFYKFTVDTKVKSFSVEMINPGGRIEPVMTVYEPDEESVRLRPERRGANITGELTAKPGDYYVEISDLRRGESPEPYTLKITLGEEKTKEEQQEESIGDFDLSID